jgi:hypothetical protein
VMVLPTFNTAFFPNFTNNERESSQLHNTSPFVTPSNTNMFLQAKFVDKPPWSVRELNSTVNPEPSSLNLALDSWGVGGSVFEEITSNNISPEYTTEYSLDEVSPNSTDTEYVPFFTPNSDTERERLDTDFVVVEEKEREVGKYGWVLISDPSPTFVNQNDTSKRDEGEDSKVNSNKSTH